MPPKRLGAGLQRLFELFLSYQGTENEGPIQREQAALLFGMVLFFAILGINSCTLFTFAFERHVSPGTIALDGVIILIYFSLIAAGLRWKRQGDHGAYIRI